uniref:Uncharacterized protein n=1 Tax=Arundo donax TaxID=35708 RepID=A0A0A9CN76_ARUDO
MEMSWWLLTKRAFNILVGL